MTVVIKPVHKVTPRIIQIVVLELKFLVGSNRAVTVQWCKIQGLSSSSRESVPLGPQDQIQLRAEIIPANKLMSDGCS